MVFAKLPSIRLLQDKLKFFISLTKYFKVVFLLKTLFIVPTDAQYYIIIEL